MCTSCVAEFHDFSRKPLALECVLRPKSSTTRRSKECKAFTFLSLKDGQRLQTVHDEVSSHWLCEWPPLWISWTFSICFSQYLANSRQTASWRMELSGNCMLNSANTSTSGDISVATLETCLCRLYATLAKLEMLRHTVRDLHVFSVRSRARVTDWTSNGDNPTKESSTC